MEAALCPARRERAHEGREGSGPHFSHEASSGADGPPGLSPSRSAPRFPHSSLHPLTDRQTLGMEAPQTGTLESTGASAPTTHVANPLREHLVCVPVSSLFETFAFPSQRREPLSFCIQQHISGKERSRTRAGSLQLACSRGEDPPACRPGSEPRVVSNWFLGFRMLCCVGGRTCERQSEVRSPTPPQPRPVCLIRMRAHLWTSIGHTRRGAYRDKRETAGSCVTGTI